MHDAKPEHNAPYLMQLIEPGLSKERMLPVYAGIFTVCAMDVFFRPYAPTRGPVD
jgi:hypothetical protein